MFKVGIKEYTIRWCPNGHRLPRLSAWLLTQDEQRYCHVCGFPVSQETKAYNAAECSNCENPVGVTWNFCPYCGQSRLGSNGDNVDDKAIEA